MIYGETRQSQWIDKFIDSFELTNSNFKFYNIKANMMIEKDIDMNELQNICLLIAQNLTNNKDEVCLKTEKSQVYVNYNDKNTGISIVGIKKNAKESYIIVDILNNKVYKNIENIYTKLENELSEYSNDVDINVCIAGEYTKKLKKAKISDILQKILYNMYAEKISDIEEENFLSVNAYSKLLKENNLKYLDREINLNIGIRYSEDDDKTMIYIATPIIKIDY
ncbi:hypothetical protein CLOBAR_00750 [Intestinibacter bartlettii DSM 16795]|jgi:hypothetical protein|nr:hypothetical protein CLOBAR_00750 [Intestinibacter bartlettii DSM 16795]